MFFEMLESGSPTRSSRTAWEEGGGEVGVGDEVEEDEVVVLDKEGAA